VPEPKDYRVLAALKAALQAISVAAGFYYGIDDACVLLDPDADVEALVAPGSPRPVVIIEQEDETWEYLASGEVKVVTPMIITWIHGGVPPENQGSGAPAPVSSDYRMKVYTRGVADIEKAIGLDASLGGEVVDTRIRNRVWQPGRNGQEVVAQVFVDLEIYRSYGVPA
jgi:hypothetical protein